MHQWRTIEVASDATSLLRFTPPLPALRANTRPRDVARRQPPGDGARNQPRLCNECGSTLGAGCVRAPRPRIGKTSAGKTGYPLLGFFLRDKKERRGVWVAKWNEFSTRLNPLIFGARSRISAEFHKWKDAGRNLFPRIVIKIGGVPFVPSLTTTSFPLYAISFVSSCVGVNKRPRERHLPWTDQMIRCDDLSICYSKRSIISLDLQWKSGTNKIRWTSRGYFVMG